MVENRKKDGCVHFLDLGVERNVHDRGEIHQANLFCVRVESTHCDDAASEWLSKVIGQSCRLVRQSPENLREVKNILASESVSSGRPKKPPLLSLANESQYLMVAQGSLEQLLQLILKREPECELQSVHDLAQRFRANLVVGGHELAAYTEEKWTAVVIGPALFQVSCESCV